MVKQLASSVLSTLIGGLPDFLQLPPRASVELPHVGVFRNYAQRGKLTRNYERFHAND